MLPFKQSLKFPSFLQDENSEASLTYQISKKSVISLMDMVKEELGNTLNPKFIKNHRKQLETPHFVFQVTNNKRTWRYLIPYASIIKRLSEFVQLEEELREKYTKQILHIPIRKENQLQEENHIQMLNFLQIFLNTLVKNKQICQEKIFLKFFNNLLPPERRKMKIFAQLDLNKRAGGRHNESAFKRFLCYFITWSNRFFTITSQGIYYTASDNDFRIEEMIPYSVGFSLLYGEAETGYKYGITLNSSHRVLSIDAVNIFNFTYFVYFLRKAMRENDFFTKKRFESFANIRQKCFANYYIDGKGYFSDLLDTLLSAKNQIFITGWMISPYFCLRRPDPQQQTRLDKVLQKVAQNGIKINIIVFMEPKIALNIDSQFTEDYLTSLSPNIKVLRHPAYLLIPFLWSHHEKMVVVDQKIAFMGGLDLGYGRWDDRNHQLNDQNQVLWPGVDYCNYRETDILKPKNHEVSSINRKFTPRMPWHDIGIRIKGPSVLDLCRHFVQYWNYVNFQLNMDERQLLLYAGIHEEMIEETHEKEVPHIDFSPLDFFKRNTNAVEKKHKTYDKYSSEMFLDGIEIDTHKMEMDFYLNHMNHNSETKINNMIKKIKEKNIFGNKSARNAINFEQLIVTEKKQDILIKEGKQNHQLLRSASMWGLGLEEGQEEKSILKAYVELIFHAKQYIYIENQFFISVENTIAKALIERISRAHELGERFRVVIIIPSLPGFDGQIDKEQAALLRVQVHHIYSTICRGQKSILQSLKFIENIHDYIQFFTLRTHGTIHNIPVSEIVYVHSKLMIVDDKIALIGSANINDRSLMGSRDSELAIVVQDQSQQTIKLKEKNRQVSSFAHNLRKQLYIEHFGITLSEAEDYFNDTVWKQIKENAQRNQNIYKEVFGIYPDNSIRKFKEIQKTKKNAQLTKYEDLKHLIKGNAVIFQRKFLKDEDLELKASEKQYFVPSINFT